MVLVPKGPRANVSDMEAARSKRAGRPGGLGYDPATEAEHAGTNYREDGETDVWAVVGRRGYSEHRFYTRSVNSHNHGERTTIRIPQGFDSLLHSIVREVPEYGHLNDMIRDALVHRAEYIQRRYKLNPETQRLLELERLRADSDRRAQDIATMRATVDDITAKLQDAWDGGDYGMFAQELDEADELIDWLREPYTSRVVGLVKDWKVRAKVELERLRQQSED